VNPRSEAFAVAASAALLICACNDSSGDQVMAPRESIRLANLLPAASILSPLTEVAAVRSLEELGDVPRQTILAEDFEDFDRPAASWPTSRPGAVEDTDNGRAFVLRSHHVKRRGWILPAQPNTHYVFERLVKTNAPLFADFEIVEARAPIMIHKMLKRGGAQALLRVHWPETPEPDETWQRGSASFFTAGDTYTLGIVLGSTLEHSTRLFRDDWPADQEAWFDDIRLSQVAPTPRQAIALLKAQALADGADPDLGIEKYGQFPPAGYFGKRRRPEDDNFSFRHALYAPPPTDLSFAVNVASDAALRFSVCLSRQTQPGHAARFEVLVRYDGREEKVWSRTLAAVPETWRWHDGRVDLSPFAGQSVELVLRTRSHVGTPHPMWGHPVLDAPFLGDGPGNVILIAVDTLRADRLSCYGYPKKTSPHLDALAADGVRFDHVASNATWTNPSFASIFTGVVPSRHGVWGSAPAMRLPARFETLAELFGAHRWATHSIAYKCNLYNSGYEQGFDVAFNVPRLEVRAQENLSEAMEWLEANADRRNFLFLHFDDPHQPFTQPAPFDRAFGEDPADHGIRMPFNIHHRPPDDERLRDVVRALYDGEVAYVDDRIGAFLDALKSRNLYDDAVIIFVSDHGEELWEHGHFGHDWGRLHDEAIRVPLIVKPVRRSSARGKVVATQVRGFDVMPTLLELAGIPVPEGLDARSLVPLLAPDAPSAPDRVAVIETAKQGLAVRNRSWKYILRYWKIPAPSETLFDLRSDPGEQSDVAAQHADVVEPMRLQTLDYLLFHRSGRYLVAVGEDSPGHHEYLIRGAASATAFFGIVPQPVKGGAVLFEGESAGPLVAVALLDTAGPITVGETEYSLEDFHRYATGDLDRLLRDGKSGLHLFEGPPHMAEAPVSLQTMDLQQIEALRALGYVGDDGKTRDDR
jgi:arylsulfatase A-like enzyme